MHLSSFASTATRLLLGICFSNRGPRTLQGFHTNILGYLSVFHHKFYNLYFYVQDNKINRDMFGAIKTCPWVLPLIWVCVCVHVCVLALYWTGPLLGSHGAYVCLGLHTLLELCESSFPSGLWAVGAKNRVWLIFVFPEPSFGPDTMHALMLVVSVDRLFWSWLSSHTHSYVWLLLL